MSIRAKPFRPRQPITPERVAPTFADAKRLRLPYYIGSACPKAHNGLRSTAAHSCVECARQSARKHYRANAGAFSMLRKIERLEGDDDIYGVAHSGLLILQNRAPVAPESILSDDLGE